MKKVEIIKKDSKYYIISDNNIEIFDGFMRVARARIAIDIALNKLDEKEEIIWYPE